MKLLRSIRENENFDLLVVVAVSAVIGLLLGLEFVYNFVHLF